MPANVPPVADERDGLLRFLEQQRYLLRIAAHGLTDDQARATPSASELSIGGLVKHLTVVEHRWMDMVLQRTAPFSERRTEDYRAGFRFGPDETLDDVLARYADAAKETDAIISNVADLGQPVPIPKDVPWYPTEYDAWSVRWVLLHLIEETARHAGHADIIRESLDGATAVPLMAAVEGWPVSPWVRPWRPTAGQ